MKLFPKKRISIIVESTYKENIIKLLEKSGASGFTLYKGIYGKGRNGIKGDYGGLGDIGMNIEIVTITSPETAEKILFGLQKRIDQGIIIIVHVIDVYVLRDDYFS
ncbi:DUF190 domain-containing protein [Desulfitibacter alkalitolerans]|uniref:DUF190 domain-containing protein n=1 Tax=Desulfitibacter alkalitolerans TaxID=264641 RepID=UPI0004870436|nr:DUF190 domain-containing protein [Desulfitibacter alkalitolerans]